METSYDLNPLALRISSIPAKLDLNNDVEIPWDYEILIDI